MPKIARFPSPGARFWRTAVLLAVCMAGSVAAADDYSDGQLAFQARDYAAAAHFWRKAAQAGSGDAKLQLGLMADLGLGRARDPVQAYGLYLEAAKLGVAEAAFNVGVMLDAGTGVAQDSRTASIWYARAAIGGSKRAAFNLGLLYRDGIGLPVNTDLAAYWLRAADSLPAASDVLKRLKPESPGALTAPTPLSADAVQVAGQPTADLVWTAGTGPQTARFIVQMVSDSGAVPPVSALETAASAVSVPVPEGGILWRVARVDPGTGQYQASPWQHQLSADAPDPKGIVSLVVNPGDGRATALAGQLAAALLPSGLIVTLSTASTPQAASGIWYRYGGDASLAHDLAGFLPGFSAGAVLLAPDLQAQPGEVVVALVMTPLTLASPVAVNR